MAPRPPLSFETKRLREALKKAVQTPYLDTGRSVGSFTCGAYAFFDYDEEPIYVGQTWEKLSGRISRHLTNQRTDSVAMAVLDPFEVCWVEMFPLVQFDGRKDAEAKRALNQLELAVFRRCVEASKFNAVLNEKEPSDLNIEISIPESVKVKIVSPEVHEIRGHADVRLARRASTIARLAQIISERQVNVGLRKTLLVQARRLQLLAEEQFVAWGGESAVPKKRSDESGIEDSD